MFLHSGDVGRRRRPAHQVVIFGDLGQVLTIRHDTLDRQAFMPGILLGIHGIRDRKGLVDSLEHLLDLP